MLSYFNKRTFPIGVDISSDGLYVSQLSVQKGAVHLIASGSRKFPADLIVGSEQWQQWAIRSLKEICQKGNFKSRKVISSIPPKELVVEHMKNNGLTGQQLQDQINNKIKYMTGLNADKLMIKHLEAEDGNFIVLAADKEKVDRYLEIYEKADLEIVSIGVWPAAMVNCYIKFFGRRQSDLNSVVMVVDVKSDHTFVSICKHNRILFARYLSAGFCNAQNSSLEKIADPLSEQMLTCKKLFSSIYGDLKIDRLVFFSSGSTLDIEQEVFIKLAKDIQLPAQLGNCLTAVNIKKLEYSGIERRSEKASDNNSSEPGYSWAMSFGLGLS
ncbi:MAG: pilus assembly protein PilM [Phycisphaerae bacterium]|nr:pilus assembly protein PilM [Phycisphaerae bacterium]